MPTRPNNEFLNTLPIKLTIKQLYIRFWFKTHNNLFMRRFTLQSHTHLEILPNINLINHFLLQKTLNIINSSI